MTKISIGVGHSVPRLRPRAIVAALTAAVGLTATCCFALGYVAAVQHGRATRRMDVDPEETTGLADRFVSVGAAASGARLLVDSPLVDGPPAAEPGSDTVAQSEEKAEPHQHVRVEYSKLYEGWPCKKDERLFQNLCYMDCGKATDGQHPYRVDSCTCCKEVPCVQLAGRFTKNCAQLDVGDDAIRPAPPLLPNCHTPDEELFMGLCYRKCSMLTKSRYTTRTGMNTCSSSIFGANWTMGIGPCSGFGVGGDNCLPHIPLPTGMGYNAQGEAGYPPMGFGYLAMTSMTKKMMPPLLQRPR